MTQNKYTRLVSIRIPLELLEEIEKDRGSSCYGREPLSRVIVLILYEHYKNSGGHGVSVESTVI